MSMRILSVLTLALIVATGGVVQAADPAAPAEVTGQVLGPDGTPVAGVQVATYWLAQDGGWEPRQGVTTDAEGRFTLSQRLSSRARSVMAFDAERAHGAVAPLSTETAAEPITLRLQRTTVVRAAYESSGLGWPIEKGYVSFTAQPAQIAVATHMGAPAFELPLPPGDYRLMVGAVDCKRIVQRVRVTKDMRRVEMGTTDLEPTIIALHYGKEPPAWTVADARGVDPETTLADFKGRWVLLEFWGHW